MTGRGLLLGSLLLLLVADITFGESLSHFRSFRKSKDSKDSGPKFQVVAFEDEGVPHDLEAGRWEAAKKFFQKSLPRGTERKPQWRKLITEGNPHPGLSTFWYSGNSDCRDVKPRDRFPSYSAGKDGCTIVQKPTPLKIVSDVKDLSPHGTTDSIIQFFETANVDDVIKLIKFSTPPSTGHNPCMSCGETAKALNSILIGNIGQANAYILPMATGGGAQKLTGRDEVAPIKALIEAAHVPLVCVISLTQFPKSGGDFENHILTIVAEGDRSMLLQAYVGSGGYSFDEWLKNGHYIVQTGEILTFVDHLADLAPSATGDWTQTFHSKTGYAQPDVRRVLIDWFCYEYPGHVATFFTDWLEFKVDKFKPDP